MTTANALGWRDRVAHVSRARLGEAVLSLLHAATDQLYVVDRIAGSRNTRMSYWVSRARPNSPGRVRQECVLEAPDNLQTARDRVVWRVSLVPPGERQIAQVVGTVVWEPDLAPDPNEYHFSLSPPAFSPATAPMMTEDFERQLVALLARQSGHTQTRTMRDDVELTRRGEDLVQLTADDRAGRVLGAGAMRVVLARAGTVPVTPSRVRAFLEPYEHFHLLDAETRADAYRLIGNLVREATQNGPALALMAQFNQLLSARLPLSSDAIETWLANRLIESGDLDRVYENDAEARASAVASLLVRANYDRSVSERLAYGIGCYNRQALREERQQRFGSASSPMNPCNEIVLEPLQEDRLSRMAADARERREAAQDNEIMAGLADLADLVEMSGRDTTPAAVFGRPALTDAEQTELLRNGWREASRGAMQETPVNRGAPLEFIRPAVEVTQEIPATTVHVSDDVVAGTPLVIDAEGGYLRIGRPGEPHQFVAAGPLNAFGQVEAMGTNGSVMLMPLGNPAVGARRSAEVRITEAAEEDTSDQVEPWTGSESPDPAPPERTDSERIRGIRSNVMILDDQQDVDPAALEGIARALAGVGLTPEDLQAQSDPVPGGITRQTMADAVAATRAAAARRTAPERERMRRRQGELYIELKRTLGQMFDPDLDDSRMTGEEVLVAHLRYRLKVLLAASPVGKLQTRVTYEDDTAIDAVVGDPRTGRQIVRVRMDDPERLNNPVDRIGSLDEIGTAGTRAIDL